MFRRNKSPGDSIEAHHRKLQALATHCEIRDPHIGPLEASKRPAILRRLAQTVMTTLEEGAKADQEAARLRREHQEKAVTTPASEAAEAAVIHMANYREASQPISPDLNAPDSVDEVVFEVVRERQ